MKIAEKVQALLNSNISRYQISQDTGIDQGVLSRLANGQTPIENIALSRGQLLADYYDAMMLNISLESRNLPVNGKSDIVEQLQEFPKRFSEFNQDVYQELSKSDYEFAEAFRSLFDDGMQDATIRSRAMLAWIDSNFND